MMAPATCRTSFRTRFQDEIGVRVVRGDLGSGEEVHLEEVGLEMALDWPVVLEGIQ